MTTVDRGNSTQASPRGHPDQEPDQEEKRHTEEEGGPFRRSREPTYGDLIGNPQIQVWIRRGAVALALFVLFAVLVNIPVGLTVAVLVVIVDVIRRSRLDSSVEAWRKPSVAERKTERQLRALQKSGYRTLHARSVPVDDEGVSDGQIDHLIVGPTGVYAIDSEKWDRRLPLRALSHRKLFLGPFNKKERLDETRWECEQASKLISREIGYEVPVQGSLAIYGPSISWKVLRVRDVDVYAGGRARNYLRRRPKILSETDIDRIYEVAKTVLPSKFPDPESSRR